MAELIAPNWPAPPGVRAFTTTRAFGDLAAEGEARSRLLEWVPSEPCWLRQVHGCEVIDAGAAVRSDPPPEADAAVARERGRVCVVLTADCLPVLLADWSGRAVGIAHAGWRGLAAGVIEAAVTAMDVEPAKLIAWLGPAIGPRAYEVGADVRAAILAREATAESAFVAVREGHWLLDLYAVARARLRAAGVTHAFGGNFCTYTDAHRFHSWRRDRGRQRMAALIWLA